MKKRLLASVLSAILIVSSVNIPAITVYAEENEAAADTEEASSDELSDKERVTTEENKIEDDSEIKDSEKSDSDSDPVTDEDVSAPDSESDADEEVVPEDSESNADEEEQPEEIKDETEEVNTEGTYAAEEVMTGECSYEEWIDTSDMVEQDNDALLQGYLDSLLYEDSAVTTQTAFGPEELTGQTLTLYYALMGRAADIADGNESSAVITLSGTTFLDQESYTYTAEELGLTSLIENDSLTQAARTAISAKYDELLSINSSDAIHYLLQDCPYQMYWYDKTIGTSISWTQPYSYNSSSVTIYPANISISVQMSVSADYGTGTDYVVDTSKTQAVQTSVENAKAIVSAHAAEDDYTKLLSYRNEICGLTGYNYSAANSTNVSYGNPWQFIYVFDGDTDTTVVCEGYSKAFQYLCDESTFRNSAIYCCSVTGTMDGGTGSGPHMWNLVHMEDGNNYIADITNSDSLSPDNDNLRLFLVGASGSVAEGYTVTYGDVQIDNTSYPGSSISYIYDKDTRRAGTSNEDAWTSRLTLSGSDYVYSPSTDDEEVTFVAQIGEHQYDSLKTAISEAQDGEKVTILKDIDVGTEGNTITDKTITIDLNGHTITGTGILFNIGAKERGDDGKSVDVTGGLTLTGTGTLSSTSTTEAVLRAQGSSDLVIGENVTVLSANGYAIDASNSTGNYQNVTINGTVKAPNGYAVGGNSTFASPASGTFTVNDGAVIESKSVMFGGDTYITGGTISVDKFTVDGTLDVTGGNITANSIEMVSDHVHRDSDATGTISGGTIKGTVTVGEGSTLTITGGTFSFDPADYIKDGYKAVENDDGTYTVTKAERFTVAFDMKGHGADIQSQAVVEGKTAEEPEEPTEEGYRFQGWYEDEDCVEEYDFDTEVTSDITLYAKWEEIIYVAQIEDKMYESLRDAINAADDGQTITILSDIDCDNQSLSIVNQSLTIDLGGHTIKGNSTVFNIGSQDNNSQNIPGSLTLTGNGTVSGSSSSSVIHAQGSSDLIVDKDVIISSESGTGIDVSRGDAQTVEVKGTIHAPAGYAIGGGPWGSMGTVTVYDGADITAKSIIVGDILEITGGTIHVTENIYVKAADVSISGGTITANGISVDDDSTSTLTITGGTFSFDPADYVAYGYKAEENDDGTYTVKEAQKFTVAFEMKGHGTNIHSQPVVEGDTAEEPETPTAEGYQFCGWYKDEDCEEEYDFDTKVTANITLYAKWEIAVAQIGDKTYESLWDAINEADDGQTITILSDIDCENQSMSIVNQSLTIDLNGHIITGTGILFNIGAKERGDDGKSVDVTGGLTLTGTGTLSSISTTEAVLRAQGSSDLVIGENVTVLSANGYAIDASNSTGNYQNVTINGTVKAPNGYAVGGNSTYESPASGTFTVNDGAVIESKSVMFGGDTYITGGTISVDKFTIDGTLDVTGGNITANSIKMVSDHVHRNSDATGTISGGTIKGTVTVDEGSTLTITGGTFNFDPEENVAAGYASVKTGDGTWEVVAESQTARISYVLNGGLNNEQNPSHVFKGEQLNLSNPTRANYDFGGWYTDSKCTKQYTDGTAVKANLTLYAHWNASEFKINYELITDEDTEATAVNSSNNPDSYTVEDANITLHAPTRKGYVFAGWYKNAELSGESVAAIDVNKEDPENPITLYAKWEKQEQAKNVSLWMRYYAYNEEDEENEWTSWVEQSSEDVNVPNTAEDVQIKLMLSVDDAETSIYYTSDKTEPDESSKLYQSPLTIADDCTIRAVAVKTGCLKGVIGSWNITIEEPQNSQLEADIVTYWGGDENNVPNGLWVAGYDDTTEYTGSNITFSDLRVYYHKTLLNATQYSVTYKNNKNVYTLKEGDKGYKKTALPQIVITGKGNYSKSCTIYFAITPRNISNDKENEEKDSLHVSDLTVAYTKKAQKPAPSVMWETTVLKAGTDYTYSYYQTEKDSAGNYIAAGDSMTSVTAADDYIIRIEGKGNYTGSREIVLKVVDTTAAEEAKPLSSAKVASIPAQYAKGYEKDSNGDYIKDEDGNYILLGYDVNDEILTGIFNKSKAVMDGKIELHLDKDYYIDSVLNSQYPGTATIVLKGIEEAGYTGIKEVTMKIQAVSISKAKSVFVDEANQETAKYSHEYTGTEICPGVKLTYQKSKNDEVKELKEGVDYTISYGNNILASSKATMTITGIGAFTGTLKKTFTITAYDTTAREEENNDVTLSLDASYPYAKGGVKPQPVVTYKYTDADGIKKKKILTLGTDYTLSYKYNTAVADTTAVDKKGNSIAPTVYVKLKGSYKGTLSKSFAIRQQDLNQMTLTLTDMTVGTKANAWKSKAALKDTDGKALAAKTDYDADIKYTYMYDTPDVNRVKGKGPAVDRHAGDAVDANDLPAAGTVIRVTVTATDKKNYTGSISGTYRILAAGTDLSKATVTITNPDTGKATYYYTGSGICPGKDEITVSFKSGKTVTTLGSDDYEIVSYSNNVNAGTATVTLRGKGDYGGTKTVKFTITKRSISE